MSKLYYTNRNFLTWEKLKTYKLKSVYSGDTAYEFIIGSVESPEGISDISMLIRKFVYDKLNSGEYKIDKEKSQYGKLVIVDRYGAEVPQMVEKFLY